MSNATTIDPFAGKAIWFLTGSQSLYGDDTLRQVADQSATVVAALAASSDIPVRIVEQPVLTTADAIRRCCLDARADDDCIGVIAWMHTVSPAKMWIAGLQALGKPLLHLHTQANRSLPWGSIDMDFMNLNQAAHGDREFGFVQTRLGLDRKTVFGHVDEPEVQTSVGRWVRAAAGWRELRHLRLARFGDNMRDVAVTEGDKVAAQMQFGMSVNTWGVNDLTDVVAQVGDGEIDELTAEYDDVYDMAADLRADGDRRSSVREAARIEVALRQFLVAGGFGAFTTNFEDLGALRQLPGVQAGLASMRPSTKARRIVLAVGRFLDSLKPLQGALDGSINGFFQEIRGAALMLHPSILKEAVAGIYTTLHQKLHVLDPDELAASLRKNVWEPLIDPLRAIDPAALKAQLDALFQDLLAKLTSTVRGMLDQVQRAIDDFLNRLRQALSKVLSELKKQIEDILKDVAKLLAQLDRLLVEDLFKRLLNLLGNLETSFNEQINRVRKEFDAMLNAAPVGGSRAVAT